MRGMGLWLRRRVQDKIDFVKAVSLGFHLVSDRRATDQNDGKINLWDRGSTYVLIS